MKTGISVNKLRIISLTFLFLLIFSCSKTRTELPPGEIRLKKDRYITIINNTGSQIKGYEVNVASSGVEIEKGSTSNNSFSIKISDNFAKDPEIEVVLVDTYERVYAKTFKVPLEGNTDTPITATDRKSEGALKDKWKDLVAWLNKNK